MKQTLLIITLFIGLGNVKAQSDATLEETIKWLNFYGLKDNLGFRFYNNENQPGAKVKTEWSVNLTSNKIIDIGLTRRFLDLDSNEGWGPSCSGPEFIKLNFSDIKKIKLRPGSKGQFNLMLTFQENVKNKNTNYLCKSHLSYHSIYFQDIKKITSLFKALKHLSSFYTYDIQFENLTELENKF